jgi:hypothetical protein
MGEAVYTAGIAGDQDGLAEIRAARRRAAVRGLESSALLRAFGNGTIVPGAMSQAERLGVLGASPGRADQPVRSGRKHPGAGHG